MIANEIAKTTVITMNAHGGASAAKMAGVAIR